MILGVKIYLTQEITCSTYWHLPLIFLLFAHHCPFIRVNWKWTLSHHALVLVLHRSYQCLYKKLYTWCAFFHSYKPYEHCIKLRSVALLECSSKRRLGKSHEYAPEHARRSMNVEKEENSHNGSQYKNNTRTMHDFPGRQVKNRSLVHILLVCKKPSVRLKYSCYDTRRTWINCNIGQLN